MDRFLTGTLYIRVAFYEIYLHIAALRDTVRAAITTFDFKMII